MKNDPSTEAALVAVLEYSRRTRDEAEEDASHFGPTIPPKEPPLPPRGGDGSSGDMWPRIAKLEAHMEHVLSSLTKLDGVPAKLAVIEERVSHLPSKGFIVKAVVSALAAVAALSGFLQLVGSLTR